MDEKKHEHLLAHLRNPTFHDEPCRLVLPWATDRLVFFYRHDRGGWRDVARLISASVEVGRFAWFPDANVAIREETAPVWDALRLADLGSSAGATVFTGVVRHELEEWLEEPHHHHERAMAIRSALAGGTWARRFSLEDHPSIFPGLLQYAHLLASRRALACAREDKPTMFGTHAEAKCDTMNAITKELGHRALGLAKKGRLAVDKHGGILINDELHCLTAIYHSLLTGRGSVILTADEDFIEVFWKAQWFFDTHYRAYLAAKLIKAGEFGNPARVLKNPGGYFEGPLTLYRRTSHLLEVLPTAFTPVGVLVIYVAPEEVIHEMYFQFEREMLDMLHVRSKTRGRCTDLFGEENIHVDLNPLGSLLVGLEGVYLGIGRDAGSWLETNNIKTFMSRLDYAHAIHCGE